MGYGKFHQARIADAAGDESAPIGEEFRDQLWTESRANRLDTAQPGLTALADIFLIASYSHSDDEIEVQWDALGFRCDLLLKILGRLPSAALFDEGAEHLAEIIHASWRAGAKTGLRESLRTQSHRARAGKQIRTSQRWRIIRQAILVTCQQQRLNLVASEIFADSIRAEVIETARTLGLHRPTKGTSTRSLLRHIEALLSNPKEIADILQECEFPPLRQRDQKSK